MPDTSFWMNARNLRQYIQHLIIIMKKSKFPSKARVTNIENKSEILDKKKDIKKGNPTETHIVYNSNTYQNHPIYYFSDSVYESSLFIFISFIGEISLLQKLDAFALAEHNKNDRFCNLRTCSFHWPKLSDVEITLMAVSLDSCCKYVITEYNWQDVVTEDTIISEEVCDKSGRVQHIAKGRKTYKIYLNSNVPYVMEFMSDIPMAIGNEELLLQKMSTDPERLIEYCRNVGNAFGKLIQHFGTSAYMNLMRNFTNSLSSDVNLTKRQRKKLLETFCEEICAELENIYGNEDTYQMLFSIKVLFIDPSLRCIRINANRKIEIIVKEEILDICKCGFNLSDTKLNIKINEINAIMIQSHIRKFLVKNLLKYHDEKYLKHLNVISAFKKIYDAIFSTRNRFIVLKRIILRMFNTNKSLEDIRLLYSLYEDLQNYLQYTILTGTSKVFLKDWCLIARCVVYIIHDQELRLLVRFIINKEFIYIIKVTNNDTMEEFEFSINNIFSCGCKPNNRGYTILVSGYAASNMQLDWKLYIGHVKMCEEPLINVNYNYPMYSDKVVYTYIPNIDEIICR